MIKRADLPAILAYDLSLTPTQAAMLARIYHAGNSWISVAQLNDDTASASHLYNADNPRSDNAVASHIHYLRKKLVPDFILTNRSYGYTLGAPGVLAIKRLLVARASAVG